MVDPQRRHSSMSLCLALVQRFAGRCSREVQVTHSVRAHRPFAACQRMSVAVQAATYNDVSASFCVATVYIATEWSSSDPETHSGLLTRSDGPQEPVQLR